MTEFQLRRMISQWCDGAMTEEAFESLCSEMRGNERAVAVFVSFIQMHASLRCITTEDDNLAELLDQVKVRLTAAPPANVAEPTTVQASGKPTLNLRRRSWRRRGWGYLAGAIAAMLLISSAALFLGAGRDNAGTPPPLDLLSRSTVDDVDASVSPSTIAQVVSVSSDCKWMFDHHGSLLDHTDVASTVPSGAIIRVLEGDMTLEFVNGVQVKLLGHTLYSAESPMRGRVLLGKCRATVCPGSEGFTLDAPTATVIDLGTEFGLEVDSRGEADVVVYDGAIEIDSDGVGDLERSRTSLNVGDAVRIASGGKMSRLTSIYSDKFASPQSSGLRVQPQRHLIVDVQDNLQRVWTYYEIAHGGMAEDVKAYSDLERAHEWNGLTALGMPEYLLGGDYVKMFKGDQILAEFEVRVTLAERADLYVLFDESVPAPRWLESQFYRTGDRLGLDMGPWDGETGDQYENGVGPGRSIDRVAAVWRRRQPAVGVVTLGATEAGELGTQMYGIVAQPAID